MKPTKKQVQLRLPMSMIQHIERTAKLAGVTPTQAYNVILALAVTAPSAAGDGSKKEKT